MRDLLNTRAVALVLVIASAAAGGTVAGPLGGAAARDQPVTTTPAVLLSPPVVRTHTRAGLAYALFVRTAEPLNWDYDDPLPSIAVSIPSLGVSGRSDRHGTISHKSKIGGWCTRVTLSAASGRSPRKHPAPAVLTLTLTSGGGQRTSVLGALADAKGRLAVPRRVPNVKLGCKAIGSPT